MFTLIGINVSYMFDQVSLANTIDQYKPIRKRTYIFQGSDICK